MTKKRKKKQPLTNGQAVFVLRGMLATIRRIQDECHVPTAYRSVAYAKAISGILGLIRILSNEGGELDD